MILNRLAKQSTRIKRSTIGCNDDPDFSLRDDRSFPDRDTEKIRMNRPQTRRQCSQLNAFDAALLDEGDRILKIVVGVLRAVKREDSSGQHWLAVNRLDNAQLVGADFD